MNWLIFYQLLPTTSVGNEEGQQLRIQILILEFKGLMVLASMILQYLSGGASELAGKLQVWFCFGNSDFFPESPSCDTDIIIILM